MKIIESYIYDGIYFCSTLFITDTNELIFGSTCKKCHNDKAKARTLPNGDVRIFCPSCNSNVKIVSAQVWSECFGSFTPPKSNS